MTLQELLRKTDSEFVAADWKRYNLKKYDQKKFAEKIKEFVDMLCGLTPEANAEDLFVAMKYLEDGRESIDADLVKKVDFEKIMDLIPSLQPVMDLVPEDATEMEYRQIINDLDTIRITTYGYEFSPWEEILGIEVEMRTVAYYGVQSFLSEVLYELSFNGMTREQQEERRKNLDAAIAECEEIKNLPEEERKACYETMEDVFGEEDVASDQETVDETLREVWRDCAKTALERRRLFKMLKEAFGR